MADYGLLNSLKKQLKEYGIGVYLTPPPKPDYPYILLELEEIWTSIKVVGINPLAKVNLKISIFDYGINAHRLWDISRDIQLSYDNNDLFLPENKSAIFRNKGIAMEQSPPKISHNYEILIQG